MLNAGEVLCDRYQILKVIGKGGMSTVYQARDLTDGKLLAVKDVEKTGKEANQVVEQSLVGEGRMLKQLSNNHLPKIYEIIEQPDNFMLIMDFISGESLDKVIARDGAQPMDRVLDWGMQICEVFSYLHGQPKPIIYRDMKPANVILQPNGHLMMIDFGTARTEKTGVAMQADTVCIGTAGFAAPEQFGGFGQSTARTDIFCLGATLYNMITGHSPCDRPCGILPLETWNPALANCPISYIIYKCTRNDPDERYQTAAELYEDMLAARNGTFRPGTGKGKSGPLSGGLRLGWQKQELKAVGGMSGVLTGNTKGKTGPQPRPADPLPQPKPQPIANSGWKNPDPIPAGQYGGQAVSTEQYQPELQENHPWRKITLIGAILAGAFALFALVLLAMAQITAGLVILILALGGAALAVVGVIFTRQAESES